VTAAVQFSDAPKVLLDVSSAPSVTAVLRVYRVHPDGSQHRVLTTDRATLIGTWTGFDFHAPINQPVTYIAETGLEANSAPSAPVFIPSDDGWLVAPDGSALLVDATFGPAPDVSFASRSQGSTVLNRKLPVHRRVGPRAGRSGSIKILCETPAGAQDVLNILADDDPVLVNLPYAAPDLGWAWVQPGEASLGVPAGKLGHELRTISFPYEETTSPDADVTPVWTFDDVTATFATFDQVTAAYADFRAMQLDIRTP
jgi:hypothetical protein